MAETSHMPIRSSLHLHAVLGKHLVQSEVIKSRNHSNECAGKARSWCGTMGYCNISGEEYKMCRLF